MTPSDPKETIQFLREEIQSLRETIQSLSARISFLEGAPKPVLKIGAVQVEKGSRMGFQCYGKAEEVKG